MANMQGYLHKSTSLFYMKLVVRLLFYRTDPLSTTVTNP